MTQMDPETSKNQIGMLKTFEINDSKPNWQKKIFPYQKCIIHLCRLFLRKKTPWYGISFLIFEVLSFHAMSNSHTKVNYMSDKKKF